MSPCRYLTQLHSFIHKQKLTTSTRQNLSDILTSNEKMVTAMMSHGPTGLSLRTGLKASKSTRRSPARRLAIRAEASVVVDAARWVVAAPTMYALVSANEYAAHRWFQHAEFNKSPTLQKLYCFIFRVDEAPKVRGGGHVEHHAETLDDMSLKTDSAWTNSAPAEVLSDDPYRGTAFNYNTTRLMLGQMFATCTPVLLVMGFNPLETAGLILAATAAHGLVWNALHPAMHGLPDVPAMEGLPSSWLRSFRESDYFRYLYQNHEGHHVGGGQCNFNVCCPLTDHLMGTYVEEDVWRPRAKLPEREEPRPQYVAGEYAANLAFQQATMEAEKRDDLVAV